MSGGLDSQAGVAELADAQDLKSCGPEGPCGSDPRPRHHLVSTTYDDDAFAIGESSWANRGPFPLMTFRRLRA